jgi:hypothetical protein
MLGAGGLTGKEDRLKRGLLVLNAVVSGGTLFGALTDDFMVYYDFEELFGGTMVPDGCDAGYDGETGRRTGLRPVPGRGCGSFLRESLYGPLARKDL